MNKQEMFDTAVRGIIEQGGPATTPKGACGYRTENGRSCAVGLLFNYEEMSAYKHKGGSVGYLVDVDTCRPQPVLRPFFKDNLTFLDSLQRAHDDAATGHHFKGGDFFRDFRQLMTEVAGLYGLNDDVLKEVPTA